MFLGPCRDNVFGRDAESERGTFGLLDTRPPVRVGQAVGPKAHVLVCAPSNSALDEIVSRLLQAGLLDWCVFLCPCKRARAKH